MIAATANEIDWLLKLCVLRESQRQIHQEHVSSAPALWLWNKPFQKKEKKKKRKGPMQCIGKACDPIQQQRQMRGTRQAAAVEVISTSALLHKCCKSSIWVVKREEIVKPWQKINTRRQGINTHLKRLIICRLRLDSLSKSKGKSMIRYAVMQKIS